MRRHKEKFPLIFKNNVEINTLADLKKYFDFRKVMGYFQNKKLTQWLDDRFYADEADALKAIKPTDKFAPQKICNVLGINYEDYSEDLDDAETIAWRRQRREHLKKFTDNPSIIKKVDSVAFNQEDLEDILSDSNVPSVIYLCNNFYRFPSGILRKNFISYIGLGDNVKVKFETAKKVDQEELGITFENITITDKEPEPEKIPEVEEVTVEEVEEEPEVEENISINRNVENKIVQASFIPGAEITNTALRFKSRISLRFDGKTTDAKSILMAKSRGLGLGQRVRILTEGEDADEAMAAMSELLKVGPKKHNF